MAWEYIIAGYAAVSIGYVVGYRWTRHLLIRKRGEERSSEGYPFPLPQFPVWWWWWEEVGGEDGARKARMSSGRQHLLLFLVRELCAGSVRVVLGLIAIGTGLYYFGQLVDSDWIGVWFSLMVSVIYVSWFSYVRIDLPILTKQYIWGELLHKSDLIEEADEHGRTVYQLTPWIDSYVRISRAMLVLMLIHPIVQVGLLVNAAVQKESEGRCDCALTLVIVAVWDSVSLFLYIAFMQVYVSRNVKAIEKKGRKIKLVHHYFVYFASEITDAKLLEREREAETRALEDQVTPQRRLVML